tara:strand:+ start:24833 stop:25330 length:498 start_codon:yes stop_codon:yes gene_type:complete
MNYRQTTQTPNIIFDTYLTQLNFSELKLLLLIIRQTFGWVNKKGNRKKRDRLSYSQIHTKTGLSRRVISQTVQSLILKQLIQVTDFHGNLLHYPEKRKGKVCIYYAPLLITYAENDKKECTLEHKHMQNRVYNKTNNTKLKRQNSFYQNYNKSDWQRIKEIIKSR